MPALVYNANIPQATDEPANSQPILLLNAQSILSLISVDHVPFAVNNDYGKHNKSTYPRQAGVPTTGSTEVVLYSALGQASAQTELYFKNQNNGAKFPITESNAFYTYLPSGNLIQWGSQAAPSSSGAYPLAQVTFPLTFADTNYQVMYNARTNSLSSIVSIIVNPNLTISGTDPNRKTASQITFYYINTISGAGFVAQQPWRVYWLAIGKAPGV